MYSFVSRCFEAVKGFGSALSERGAFPTRRASDRCYLAILSVTLSFGMLSLPAASRTNVMVVEIEGRVAVSRAESQAWNPAQTNQVLRPRDRMRTYERSRALLRWSDLSTYRMGPDSLVQIPEQRSGIHLLRGLLYYFHRDKPGTFPVQTPSAYAVILGTEFTVAVDENGATLLTLIDGEVELTNQFGRMKLASGEAAIAERNSAPRKTPAIETVNVIQWVLSYPGVLDVDELSLNLTEQQALATSLAAYRNGDLLAALTNYPAGREPASDEEKVYFAALLLAVGQAEQAEKVLQSLAAGTTARVISLRDALRRVIAAVKFQPVTEPPMANWQHVDGAWKNQAPNLPSSATVLLAESYYAQAQADLKEALTLARRSVEASPNFAFALARVAELEFSFGRVAQARTALDKSLALARRNAQAVALKGFLFAAENRIADAIAAFDEAIALDGALGNAWLGRGLCRLRQGNTAGGREDLQVAVTLEPQRAIFRSYLGKAFGNEGDMAHANDELQRARDLDANDPTVWLYSALLNQQQNRINEAVRDLEHAGELDDNRRVYRSRLLLDQDRAVQSVNLAGIYEDVGMLDVSAREAGRAVELDPANYAAHLFLGDTYQRLRDPARVNQRFETAAVTEYLLANLLSPVGAGTLAQSVTQNEYSRLVERDGFGVSSTTEYYSRGAWWQSGAQYGTFGNSSYAVSAFYNSDNGQRANNDVEQSEYSVQFKHQITMADSIYFRVIRSEIEGGDLLARQNSATANRTVSVEERQEPLLLAGYHHEWAPGIHTLGLIGWLTDELAVTNGRQQTLLLGKNSSGAVTDVAPITISQDYESRADLFTAELQQLWQQENHTFIVGARYQGGEFDTDNRHANANLPAPIPGFVAALFPKDRQEVESDFERITGYGYYHWRPVRSLLLAAGVSYDRLEIPANFRYAPLLEGEDHVDQVSPKGGVIWTPAKNTTFRAAYSQSLGGVGFDQSFRLEPTQIAGFNQGLRSLIPESVVGANSAEEFETTFASVEQRIGSGTYLGISGEWLQSEVSRELGVYDFLPSFRVARSSTRQRMDFDERTLVVTLNQLVGDEWAFGTRYRLSHAELDNDLIDVPAGVLTVRGFKPRTESDSLLHEMNLFAIYNHPRGFFGEVEGLWNSQNNDGAAALGDEDFWQLNLFAGWRGYQRRCEIRLGILNVTEQNYRLNPLNLTPELPRERTFVARLKFNF